jgi:hypothetical protein
LIKELLGILGILILLVKIYLFIRRYWLRRLLEKKKKGNALESPPYCVRRVNMIAAFARKIKEICLRESERDE